MKISEFLNDLKIKLKIDVKFYLNLKKNLLIEELQK